MTKIFDFNDADRSQFIGQTAHSLPAGTKVLDAGAGPCRYKQYFSHCDYRAQDFAQYTGSDHSYGTLDYVCDITSIPAPDQSFDFILCSEVFEHLPRPDLALTEFARLLRPGGEVLITAPLGSGIHMAPYHYYGGFSPYWYQHFLPEAGFDISLIKANGGFFKLYGQESRRFLTMITPAHPVLRAFFLPLKLVLALWFRLIVPVVCHWLDRFDRKQEFTVGYFVRASKR